MAKNKIYLKLIDKYLTKYSEDKNEYYEKYGSFIGADLEKLEYEHQLEFKKEYIEELLKARGIDKKVDKMFNSPLLEGYRNKMEYSFGNEEVGGVLNLGMHKPKRFYDIVKVYDYVADDDFRKIVDRVEKFCRKMDYKEYHKAKKTGNLRNLSIRKSHFTGEILVAISTSSNEGIDILKIKNEILNIENLDGKIVGILHLVNDRVVDVVESTENDRILYGRDYFNEKLFDLNFKVSFFSFFQTNTLGAEILYERVIDFLGKDREVVFDLFCGTGTISQVVSKKAKKVIGVEIIEDAVKMANENKKDNGIENCEFIADDVFNALDNIKEKPEIIIVDPPRAGLLSKTIKKLMKYEVEEIIYVSCNPVTLAIDLEEILEYGYEIKRLEAVDLYPHTGHVESVVLMSRVAK